MVLVAFFFWFFRLATAFQGHFPKNFPLSLVIQLLLPLGCVCVYGLCPFQNRRGLFFWWQFVQKQQNSTSKCSQTFSPFYQLPPFLVKVRLEFVSEITQKVISRNCNQCLLLTKLRQKLFTSLTHFLFLDGNETTSQFAMLKV